MTESASLAVALVLAGVIALVVLLVAQPPLWGRLLAGVSRLLPGERPTYLQLYGAWRAGEARAAAPARLRGLLWKWLAQLLVLAALQGGVFWGAAVLAAEIAPWWPEIALWAQGSATALWLGALLLNLPILAAFLAKLKAAAITAAELRVGAAEALPHVPAIRAVAAAHLMLAGSLALVAWSALLCYLVTPPLSVVTGFALLLATLAGFSWRSWYRFYVRAGAAQAVRETEANRD